MFNKTKASKEQVKLMIGITGPSGAGKTYSALQLAYGITQDWTKIVVADTENRSALYYAGERTGLWDHIDFPPTMPGGYHPNNWIKVIEFAESDPNIEVLILDSISHEWEGPGGCLSLLEAFSRDSKGNTFTPWKKITPLHDAFVDKMRYSRLHIIATMRSSTEYSMEKNDQGKTVPKKIGMKPTQRAGLDYDFGILFDVDIGHYATATKDRTNLFFDKPPFLINSQIGQSLKEWSKDGLDPEVIAHQMRVNRLLAAFGSREITAEDLESYIGKAHIDFGDADFEKVQKIWPDIRDGKMIRDDFLAFATIGE